MHHEKCGCGASVFSFRFKRVVEWRESHRHEPPAEDEATHYPNGPGGSDNQLAYADPDYSHPTVGFTPNGMELRRP